MPLPPQLLPHTCTITQRRPTPTGEHDPYGNPIRTETPLPPKPCLLTHRTSTPTDQGQLITAECLLQPTTDTTEGDKLTTTTPGYTGDYWITSVTQIYTPTGRSINHTKLHLTETQHTQG